MSRRPPPSGSRHAAIASALRKEIEDGSLPPGRSLPSEAALARRFGVSRGTVRQALGGLRAEGLVVGGRGRPPVVARAPLAQSFDEMVSFTAWAEQLGRVPGARTLELASAPATAAVAAELGIDAGSPTVGYRRLRLLDGVPAMIERSTFVDDVGALLFDCDLDGGSVYAQLADRGVTFAEAEQTIAAVVASSAAAALLDVARRAPLLEVRRRVLGGDGRPLESSVDTYRGDAFVVTVHNRIAQRRAAVGLTPVPDRTG